MSVQFIYLECYINITMCDFIIHYFTPVNGRLGCFQVLPTMNHATTEILIRGETFLGGIHLGADLLSQEAYEHLILGDNVKLFSKVLSIFEILTSHAD